MGFLAIVNAYTMRICLSIAITEMVVTKTTNESSTGDYCEAPGSDSDDSSSGGDFEWSESLQGIILGSFFVGYVRRVFLKRRAFTKDLFSDDHSHSWRNSLGEVRRQIHAGHRYSLNSYLHAYHARSN